MTSIDGITTSTMSALAEENARRYPQQIAARYREGDGWTDKSYAEMWEQVHDLAVGLIDLGLDVGDRVCILADTSYDWSVANLAVTTAAGVVVPIYPTNSPEECAWVLGDSGARIVICENAKAVAKIDEVRSTLPDLQSVVVMHAGRGDGDDGADDLPTVASVSATGHALDDADLHRRIAGVTMQDAYLIIYTSGTTGRPKGVVLTHGGFAEGRHIITELGLIQPGDIAYLYLPLAHVFAQVIQADVLEVGATICYYGGDTTQIISELAAVKPTIFWSVPRMF